MAEHPAYDASVLNDRRPPKAPPQNIRFGPYTLIDRLAVGGMAEVFRAHEPRPVGEPRIVVIKRMLPEIAAQPGSRAMFEAEAKLGGHVVHENVVEVLGLGEENGQPYLALEYVRGVDLWRLSRFLMREGRVLGVPLTMFVMRELLAGLHAVHEARDENGAPLNIVHRDVSPSNVLLSIHGDVKLGDFGIAFSELRDRLPQAAVNAHAKGKLGYLAPEQVSGQVCDRRADVWSAAVITAELLMGRPLFSGGSELAILLAIRDAKVHPFLEVAGTLPAGLGDVVLSALAMRPEDRIATAAELRAELGAYQDNEDSALRRELAELLASALHLIDDAPEEPTPMSPEESLTGAGTPLHAVPKTPSLVFDEETNPAHSSSDVERALAAIEAGDRTTVPGERETLTPDTDVEGTPTSRYEVQTTDGKRFGPWPYAQLVEALALGRVGPDDRVRSGGGAYQRVGEIGQLARHLPLRTLTPVTREQQEPKEVSEMVPLSHGGIITALAWTVVKQETGLWLCELGGVRKEVYVKDGSPEFVTSNLAGELLGEYLVSSGVITRGELDMALAVLPRFEGRLGDTLAALGLVEPVHLFQHIAAQVREKLLDLFLWTGGHAAFYEGVPPPSSAFPLGLDGFRILDEGIRRRVAQGLEDERFGGRERDSLVEVVPLPAELDPTVLPREARAILDALRSPVALGTLEQRFGDTAKHTLVLLFHLNAVAWA
jgi:serine/threonine-protein kinase